MAKNLIKKQTEANSTELQQGLKGNFSTFTLECGCDEAGRGCLAGPVVAAAVILPQNFECPLLNDSKQLTEQQRETLRPIIEKEAVAWAVAEVDNHEIDEINILNASILAMHRAVQKLTTRPEFIIVDGNRFKPLEDIPHQTIVKGDSKYLSIAAASVLAKTYRDELMQTLHAEFPHYDWDKNKAYPTLKHRASIREHGTTGYHRMTFNLLGGEKKAVKKRKK
jgi:ribonuclease HII